jgi:hypothetical protein
MRGRIRAGAFGLGCAGLAVLTLVSPAAGERNNGPDQGCARGCQAPSGGNLGADCEDASMNTPRGEPGDLKLTSDVHQGATVAPGQDIRLTLRWDQKRWSGQELDRALDCVRVKGELAPDLSAEEAPTPNDGVFEYRLHVPDDIKPGCDICAEGFLSGDAAGGGGPLDVRSDRYCFLSGRPGPASPPGPAPTGPPSPSATPPPAPPAMSPPAPTPPPNAAAARIPTEVSGITAGQPAVALTPAPARAPAPAAELPRTGSAGSRTGTAGGGLALCLGGFALMGGSGRRTRRRTAT